MPYEILVGLGRVSGVNLGYLKRGMPGLVSDGNRYYSGIEKLGDAGVLE